MKKVLRYSIKFLKNFINKIRIHLLKTTNTQLVIGKRTKIDAGTKIISMNNLIELGNDVYLRSQAKYYQAGMPFSTTLLTDVKGAFIKIGDQSRLNGVYVHAQRGITIGDNCVIASGVNIIDSNGHELLSRNRTVGRDIPEEIVIGSNVWIGVNAIILKGTSIGQNSVISAGSIVKGIFPENSLIVGNPAKLVKTLDI